MAGYLCIFGEDHGPATQLITSLETGLTMALCAGCLPVGLAGALAEVLGIDPDALYDAVTALQRYLEEEDRQATIEQEMDLARDLASDIASSEPVSEEEQ